MKIFIYLVSLVCIVTCSDLEPCPLECNCTERTEDGLIEVSCRRYLPDPLWASIPNDTAILKLRKIWDIDTLKAGIFDGLDGLEELEIRDTSIKILEPGCFDGLDNLFSLKIEDSKIEAIPSGVLSPLKGLTNLDLQDNKISSIDTDAFSGLERLEYLSLSSNALTRLPCNIFNDQKLLETLYLKYNRIGSITGCEFKSLIALKTLSLSNNVIGEIHAGAFVDLPYLSDLQLIYNRISSMSSGSLKNVPELKTLSLEGNSFEDVPSGALSGAGNLRKLILTANPIDVLTENSFQGVSESLSLLIMRRMYMLYAIENGAFNGLTGLQSLVIEDSYKLAIVATNLFTHPMPELTSLYLENNRLMTLHEDTFSGLESLTSLQIGRNPFRCDCYLKWIPEVIASGKYNWSRAWAEEWTGWSSPRCRTPLSLEGRRFGNLKPEQLECTTSPLKLLTSTTQHATKDDTANFTVERECSGMIHDVWISAKGRIINRTSNNGKLQVTEEKLPNGNTSSTLSIHNVSVDDGGRYIYAMIDVSGVIRPWKGGPETSFIYFDLIVDDVSDSNTNSDDVNSNINKMATSNDVNTNSKFKYGATVLIAVALCSIAVGAVWYLGKRNAKYRKYERV